MQNTYLYGFATFGQPHDYRQSPFKFDDENIAKKVKIFDLSNAIKVFPNTTLYAVRKENAGGYVGISYAVYTFVHEMSTKRDGTFIGSSIMYTQEAAAENITISQLNEFHQILVNKNTKDNTLTINHSKDFVHSKEFLNDFEKVAYNLNSIENIDNLNTSNKHLLVGSRTDPNTLTGHFGKAQLLLNQYDTIFFTNSRDVIEYSKNRNIYSITDEKGFEQEVAVVLEDRKKKVSKVVSEFEKEKQKLLTDKTKVLGDLKAQHDKNKNIHLENGKILKEADSVIEKINVFYADFTKLLDDYANQLKKGRKLEEVNKLYGHNKDVFLTSLASLKQAQYVKKIGQIKTDAEVETEFRAAQNVETTTTTSSTSSSKVRRRKKYNIYKVASAAFATLWVATLLFLLFPIKIKSAQSQAIAPKIIVKPKPVSQASVVNLSLLNPVPTTKLNQNDLRLIAKKGIKFKTAKEIVELIFAQNPTDIASVYANQKPVYEQILVAQNPNCFKNNVCLCDSLVSVPSSGKVPQIEVPRAKH